MGLETLPPTPGNPKPGQKLRKQSRREGEKREGARMEEDGNGRSRQATLRALWEQSHYLAGARVPQWMWPPGVISSLTTGLPMCWLGEDGPTDEAMLGATVCNICSAL